ncbi:MAG TPA: biopolymer transporter ExbD [Thermoanaerobaculia bacterium]
MEHNVKDTNVMAEINVTPMVDVMLVLLIIFMVVTPALMAGFQAELPTGIHLIKKADEEDRTELGIGRDNAWYLNKKPIPQCGPRPQSSGLSQECADEARRLLTADFELHPDDRVMFVKADASVLYGELLAAMDIGRDAGAVVLSAVTEAPPSEEED